MLKESSLDQQASGTAMSTAFLRALAASDPRPDIRGSDHLAELFLDEEHLRPLKDSKARLWVMQNKIAPGAYEFMVARTAFFDEVVRHALQQDIAQLVLLGAGYDSRPYRFADLVQATRLFELDTAPTQERKQQCLLSHGIVAPNQLAYVAINFETDNLEKKLSDAGYRPDATSLFIWEGVSYYLTADAVDGMLAFIASHSPAGSSIAFDYASVSAATMQESGARELRDHLRSQHANEPVRFGIPAGETNQFLAARGFDVIEHLNAPEMKDKYLAGSRYPELGTPPSLLCLVYARVT